MRTRLLLFTAGVLLAFAATASASYYVPKAGQACRSGYRREVVRVRERRHGKLVRRDGRVVWVRQARCVLIPPKVAAPTAPTAPSAPAPSVSYQAKVDPTFVQAATDPLAVTYSYSADATATLNGQVVDLAATNQLPAGVLDLYSAQTPGGPESLYCSVNVGGAVSSASCPIAYQQTGTFAVTTEYIPNAASAVTETDQETISPFATTTTLTVTPVDCGGRWPPNMEPSPGMQEACYSMVTTASDQNGASLAGTAAVAFSGQPAGMVTLGQACTLEVAYSPQDYSAGPTSEVFSPDCVTPIGSPTGAYLQAYASGELASWTITGSYAGKPGWAASSGSAPVAP